MGKDRPQRQNLSGTLKYGRRYFYGRRTGHALNRRLAGLLDRLLPHLRLDLNAPHTPQDWFAPKQYAHFALEIGFGSGEHLLAAACAHPEIGFIGCELFTNGIAKLLRGIEHHNIDNIRIYDDVAQTLLDAIAPDTLDTIFLLYPDPWPKRRHYKRRFVNSATLSQFFTRLKIGGELLIVSDNADYIAWCLMHLKAHGGFAWSAQNPHDWRTPPNEWKRTRYEMRAQNIGAISTYLHFTRRTKQKTGHI